MKRINETTGESTFKKGGKVMAVNTRVLSADGKTLTITTKGTTSDGKPRHDVAVNEKQAVSLAGRTSDSDSPEPQPTRGTAVCPPFLLRDRVGQFVDFGGAVTQTSAA